MLNKFISDLAKREGIKVTVRIKTGQSIGCLGADLVYLSSGKYSASVLAYESDIETLKVNGRCDRLEGRIRAALSELKP